MKKYIKLIILLFIPFLIGQAEFSDYTTLINQKMVTERRLEEHIGGIVSKVIGEGRSTVIISVELSDMKKSRIKTEQWLEKATENVKGPAQAEEFLPGIPLKSSLKEEDDIPEKSGGKKIEDILTLPAEFIKSIKVSLVIDKTIPDDVVATVETIINDIMDLDPARGDRLTIQRVSFADRAVDFVSFLFNPYFYIISIVLLTLAIMALFLFGPLRKFLFAALQTLKDLKGIKSQTEVAAAGSAGAGAAGMGVGEGEMEMEEEEESSETEEGPQEGQDSGEGQSGVLEGGELEEEEFEKMTYKPLKFLEDKDLKKLAYLLNFEPPEVGALLISYLGSDKAAKVMIAIPSEKRAQVAKSIVKIQQSDKEILQHIDEFLSKKIEYVAGGADKLVSLMEMMNDEERDNLLESLSEDDPEFAEKIRNKILGFENVANLDDNAIQLIIQELETRDLGIALKNTNEDIKQKFISNMSEGAAALLKEEIEFGRMVSESEIKVKQGEIISKVKQLEAEGMISGLSGAGVEELWEEEIGTEKEEGVMKHIIDAAHHALSQEKTKMADAGMDVGDKDEVAFEYYQKGLQAYKDEDYAEAIEQFQWSIKYNPDVWQTHQYVGSCYLATGDDESAKKAYGKSLQLNPDNSELKSWLQSH
ncbi:FliG C-terminal domain-containing protein [Elusimicrobiota bacterium]